MRYWNICLAEYYKTRFRMNCVYKTKIIGDGGDMRMIAPIEYYKTVKKILD